MSKPDIVALDDASTYAYSSHISIEGTEIQIGDLLLVFDHDDEQSVNFFERVYGFNWPGAITHQINGPVPADIHEFEDLADDLANRRIAVAPEIEQASFFVDDDMVRTLSLYEYSHRDGQQPILIDEIRDPLSRTPSDQTVTLCTDGSGVIGELFEANPPSSKGEAEEIRAFLHSGGYDSYDLPESEQFQK
ncbi:hypothetical protein ACFQMA_07985 [Halosimplex aquaticum]|uniref:Uncharacterized protein n=1 Tax=Halosimplex aquaticum TaxID=3026162 RepID=A0ABD5Y0K5_9EURY|nr:hypothetical protein [Halosimplex aquaticum]